jgi:hypothetical protein
MIPQLILKGSIAATSDLCAAGNSLIVPDRVFIQFEKLLGHEGGRPSPAGGVLTVMTYGLGPTVAPGSIRSLQMLRTLRLLTADLAPSFSGAGEQLALGPVLEQKVGNILRGP